MFANGWSERKIEDDINALVTRLSFRRLQEIGGKNMSSSPAKGSTLKQDSIETQKPKASTYTAVQVSEPGQLRVVQRRVAEPGPGQVRIRVEACGICHTDATTVMGTYPGLTLPRVPGHEVIGRIEALGTGVFQWKIGQRVGVGLIAGEDGVCEPCRRGDMVNCQSPVTSWVNVDGGYAEVMIAEARGMASIPDELSSAEAAPLLCAGVTTYNALRNAGLRAGDLVAVQGIGGLGHLGVQFARRMGFRTVAIGRGRDKENLQKIWAHTFTSMVPSRTPQRCCSAWAGPERFSQREPVVMLWGDLWPVSQFAASSSWLVHRKTRSS